MRPEVGGGGKNKFIFFGMSPCLETCAALCVLRGNVLKRNTGNGYGGADTLCKCGSFSTFETG